MAWSARYLLFLQQPERENRFLAILRPMDAATEAVTALYQATGTYGTKATDSLPSQRFEAQLLRGFENTTAVNIEEISGILPGSEGGTIRILQRFGNLDSWRKGYYFDGRQITILHGGWSEATGEIDFDDYGEIFDGEIDGQPMVGLDYVDIDVRDPSQNLDFPICERYHRGIPWMLYGDGVNDYVDAGTDTAFNFTTLGWCIEQGFCIETAPAAATPGVSKSSSGDKGYRLLVNADLTVSLVTYQTGGVHQTTTSVTPLVIGKPTMVSFLMLSTGTCLVYIDGQWDASGTGHIVPSSAAGESLLFLKNSASTLYLNTFLFETRIWSAPQTVENIADRAFRKLTAAERLLPALAGYWPADDGSGLTLTDRSGTGADGTITGAVFHRALEGAESLEGERMLEVWGPQPNITAHQVESNPPIWQIHSAEVNALLFGREGGAPRTVNSPFTSRAAFLAATTAAPTIDVLISAGGTFARAPIPAQKKMTFDVEGDKSGGTYTVSGPNLIRKWLTTRGPYPVDDATEIDDAAFDAAAAADTAPHQLVYDGDTMLRECIQKVARSGGYTVLRDPETKLWTIHRFAGVAAEIAAAVDPSTLTDANVVKGSLTVTKARPPAKRVSVYCEKNPTEFSTADFSFELLDPAYDELRRFLLQEFSTAPANRNFRGRRRQAREIFIDSTLATYADGREAAQRELELWSHEEQGISFLATAPGLVLKLMTPLYFQYQDESEDGAPQLRLDTSSTAAFIAVARSVDLAQGAIRITIYREAS